MRSLSGRRHTEGFSNYRAGPQEAWQATCDVSNQFKARDLARGKGTLGYPNDVAMDTRVCGGIGVASG